MSDHATLVQLVALHLGAPWKYNHIKDIAFGRFEIIDGQGRGLTLVNEYGKPRFKIYGQFPPAVTSRYFRFNLSIGVGATRPARDIARDIERRLLPQYLEAFEQAKAEKRQEDDLEKRLDITACALAKVTNGRISPHDKGQRQRRVYFDNGTAEFFCDGTVTLKLSNLSAEQAITLTAGLFHQTQT